MVERIVPRDPRLAAREQRAIEELRSNYPDGIVTSIDTTHKQMGKRLTKLYRDLGYESRADMLAALGFTLVVSTGGRQAVDHEALFAELERRYEGKAKPTSIGILKHENPDLSATIKTVGNNSNELFGHTMTVELIERGLLDKKLPPQRESFDDDVIKATIDALMTKYADVKNKPKRLTELKELEPGSAKVLEYLSSSASRSTNLFGCSITKHLKSCGVLAADAASIDDEAVVLLLDTLQELYQRKPNDEKPKSIAALIADQPEHAETLKAGKKKRLVTKDILMDRGILAMPKSVLQARAKALKERCVRNAKVSELARMYTGSGCADVVLPDEQVEYLRPGVAGVDLKYNYELRETIVTAIGGDLSVGDALDATFGDSPSYYSHRNLFLSSNGTNVARIRRSGGSDFLTEMTFEDPTPLKQYEGAEVIKVEYVEGVQVARIRYRFLETLSHETLLYALYRVGALSDDELYANDDSWRTRLESMSEDPSRSDGSEKTATSGNEKIELDSSTGEQPDSPAKLQFKLGKPDAEQASGQTGADAAKLHFKLGKPDAEQTAAQAGVDGTKLHVKTEKTDVEQASSQDGASAANNPLPQTSTETHSVEETPAPGTWTFNQHQRAKGRRFSIEVPDQWTLTPNEGGRPLARYQRGDADPDECPAILYSGLQEDLDDDYITTLRKNIIPEARIQLTRSLNYYGNDTANSFGRYINDWIIEGKNCQVIVLETVIDGLGSLMPNLNELMPDLSSESHEYMVRPVSYDHEDSLRITDSWNHLGEGQLKELALAVARTVELDKPVELDISTKLERYQETCTDFDALDQLVDGILNGLCLHRDHCVHANTAREVRRANNDKSVLQDSKKLATVIAKTYSESLNTVVAYFDKLVTVLETQRALGSDDFEKMWVRVGEFADRSVNGYLEISDDKDLEREINSLGIISIPVEYQAIRDRWEALDPSRPDTNENSSFDLKLANIDFEFTVGTSQKT